MIKEIRLSNWKSFREATLYFDPLAILIGTNASGKSNAIDALDFLSRIARSKDLVECLQATEKSDSFRGGIDWVALKGEPEFALSVRVTSDDSDIDYRYEITVSPASRPVITAESLHRIKCARRRETSIKLFWTETCEKNAPAITARLYNTKRGTPREMQRGIPVLTQLQFASSSVKSEEITNGIRSVWSALGHLFILNPIPSHMRSFSTKAEKLEPDASNLAGVIAALPSDHKKEVESTILRYVRDLPEKDIQSLSSELYGPFESDAMLVCGEGWESDGEPLKVDSRAMSDGTLRFIAITAALLTLPEQTQLVIEEIDNGLHPSRSQLLLKMIREIGAKRKIDVLASTHNPALLNELGPEMVPFVVVAHREKESGHSRLTLLEDIKALPKLLSEGRIGTIATSGALEKTLQRELNK